jgi:aflatoxin B1 aldehyde reductase
MPLIVQGPKPRIILGLMNFGPDADAGARVTSLPEYSTFLDHLQGAGYNEVDTARIYVGGKQEAFTREAGWKDRGLAIATKVYPTKPGMHAPDVLTEQFNTSLKELGADCVDIFYLHAAVSNQPPAGWVPIRVMIKHSIGPLRSIHRNSRGGR